jgi:hypothetical protein
MLPTGQEGHLVREDRALIENTIIVRVLSYGSLSVLPEFSPSWQIRRKLRVAVFTHQPNYD